MINAEKELAVLITELQCMKATMENNVASQTIVGIQKLCASNIYVESASIDVEKQYNFLKGFIKCGEVSLELNSDQVQEFNSKLDLAYSLINKVTYELGYILKRPELKHIDSHCNSSIALALSFLDRWSVDSDPTHGSTCAFGLYVVNSPKNKAEVFQASFGLATLMHIKSEIEKLETFESIDLHEHLK